MTFNNMCSICLVRSGQLLRQPFHLEIFTPLLSCLRVCIGGCMGPQIWSILIITLQSWRKSWISGCKNKVILGQIFGNMNLLTLWRILPTLLCVIKSEFHITFSVFCLYGLFAWMGVIEERSIYKRDDDWKTDDMMNGVAIWVEAGWGWNRQ